MNDTNCEVNLPGYWHHGDCKLLCRTPSWQDIIIFYLGNYVAHTATVMSTPGQSIWVSISTAAYVLVFPGAGIYRAIQAITSGAIFAPTELQQAARAGAIYMVVRDGNREKEVAPNRSGPDTRRMPWRFFAPLEIDQPSVAHTNSVQEADPEMQSLGGNPEPSAEQARVLKPGKGKSQYILSVLPQFFAYRDKNEAICAQCGCTAYADCQKDTP
jgi:hypothetical protein